MNNLQDWIRHGEEMRRPLLVNHNLSKAEKIIIVGAGLSGLCTAFRIAEKRPDLEIIIIEKEIKINFEDEIIDAMMVYQNGKSRLEE